MALPICPYPHRHLLGIEGLHPHEILGLLDRAEEAVEVSRQINKRKQVLQGRTQINLFFENSTRTQSSFELAGKRLGADVMNMAVSHSSVKKGETLIDTAATLNAMHPDLLVVRHHAAGAVHLLARKVGCSVVNAGDGPHEHPTQALLDALEAAGIAAADIQTRRAGLRPVFEQSPNGDAAPVPVAFEADSLLTVKVRDLSVLSGIYGAASEAGATRFDGLRFELSDPAEALAGARGAAVGDARLRAETYAQAAGLTLGSVLEIAEPGSNPRPMEFRSMAADMGAMPVAPGSLTVSAQITVVYALTE